MSRYRALLIGNSHYPADEANLPDLNGPLNDMSGLAQVLCDPQVGLFRRDDVAVLAERPSYEIAQALEKLLAGAGRGEVLLLYYSGHGLTADDNGSLLLCARDSRTDRPLSTTVSSELVSRLIRLSAAETVIIILDCCYAGSFKGGSPAAELAGRGRFVLAASRQRERTPDARHTSELSRFTSHLIRGLRGEASAARPPYLTMSDLYTYVHAGMIEDTGVIPYRTYDGVGDVAIARVAPTPGPSRAAGSKRKKSRTRRTAESAGDARAGRVSKKTRPLIKPRMGLRVQCANKVWAVRFSPSGRHLAGVSEDATARVWQLDDGQQMLALTHDDRVSGVAFHPEGTQIASSSYDSTVRIWSTRDGRLEHELAHDDRLWGVDFHPTGDLLVTAGSGSPSLRLWQLTGGEPAETDSIPHQDLVTRVAFSQEGDLLATVGLDDEARLWQLKNGHELLSIKHDGVVSSAVLSGDGSQLVTASRDGTARVWDGTTGAEMHRLPHAGVVNAAVFSPNGRYVATGGREWAIRLWDAGTGGELLRIDTAAEVNDVTFSPDGRHVAVASVDGSVTVWQVFP